MKWLATSHPDLYDFPVTPIVLEQGKKGLKWYKKVGESYNVVNLVDIKQGVYSPTLCIGTDDGNTATKDLTFSLFSSEDETYFSINNLDAEGNTATELKMNKDKDSRACFQIGAKKGAPLKKYYLKFKHTDTGDDATYIDVPLLEADLDTSPVTINFASMVECVKGGASFPITFDIGTYPPLEELTIKLTTSNSSPEITTTTSSLKLMLGNDAG